MCSAKEINSKEIQEMKSELNRYYTCERFNTSKPTGNQLAITYIEGGGPDNLRKKIRKEH